MRRQYALLHLAEHLAAQQDWERLYQLLTGDSRYLDMKYRAFRSDVAYRDDLDLALQSFSDVTIWQPETLLHYLRLIFAKQLVLHRAQTYDGDDLPTLLDLQLTEEARGAALLQSDTQQGFGMLITVYENARQRNLPLPITFQELLDRAVTISDPFWRVSSLCQLLEIAYTDAPGETNSLINQIEALIAQIGDGFTRDDRLAALVGVLVRHDALEKARTLVPRIERDIHIAKALRHIVDWYRKHEDYAAALKLAGDLMPLNPTDYFGASVDIIDQLWLKHDVRWRPLLTDLATQVLTIPEHEKRAFLLLLTGRYMQLYEHEALEEYVPQVIAIADQIPDRVKRAKLFCQVLAACAKSPLFNQVFEATLAALDDTPDSLEKDQLIEVLASDLLNADERHITLVEQVVLTKTDNPEIQARILSDIAAKLAHVGRFADALALTQRINSYAPRETALFRIARGLMVAGEWQQAEKIAEERLSPVRRAKILRGIALRRLNNGDETALDLFFQAERVGQASRDDNEWLNILFKLTDLFLAAGDLLRVEQLLDFASDIGSIRSGRVEYWRRLARQHANRGNYRFEHLLRRAQELAATFQGEWSTVWYLSDLAVAYETVGDERREEYYTAAMKRIEQVTQPIWQANAWITFAENLAPVNTQKTLPLLERARSLLPALASQSPSLQHLISIEMVSVRIRATSLQEIIPYLLTIIQGITETQLHDDALKHLLYRLIDLHWWDYAEQIIPYIVATNERAFAWLLLANAVSDIDSSSTRTYLQYAHANADASDPFYEAVLNNLAVSASRFDPQFCQTLLIDLQSALERTGRNDAGALPEAAFAQLGDWKRAVRFGADTGLDRALWLFLQVMPALSTLDVNLPHAALLEILEVCGWLREDARQLRQILIS
jgi:hypothetical protein